MHGFLNILAAAALAPRVDAGDCCDGSSLKKTRAHLLSMTNRFVEERANRSRRADSGRDGAAFLAYGSCSFAEPVEDLTALGLLPPQ